VTYRYDINAPTDDPTFGGTVPLKRVDVDTTKQPGDRREARVLHNGVPCSAHWFTAEAKGAARNLALANGLGGYYVDGVFVEVQR
jgi:hypothetical protein